MFEPTGSVYLDSPRPQPPRRSRPARNRALTAGVFGFIGLVSMALAGVFAGLHFLVTDPGPTLAAVNASLDDPVARSEMVREMSATITDKMVGPDIADAAAFYGIDVSEESAVAAEAMLDDATFRAELDKLVGSAHHLAVVDAGGRPADLTALTGSALAVMNRQTPELAALISSEDPILAFDSGSLPDLSAPLRLVDNMLLASLIGMVALPLAALIHPRRHRVLAWAGRLWVVTGAVSAVAIVTLPYIGGRLSGWSTVEVAIRSEIQGFLVPAIGLGLCGLMAITAAAVARRRELTRVSREGAGAALGVESFDPTQGHATFINLDNGGLVDASRRLTSI